MIDAELLKILCCPETHQEVCVAEASVVEQLNGKISAGGLKNRSGGAVSEKLDGGLVRADGKFLYPIRREIPVMLVDQAIPLTGAA
jgi:uncharacterized protein YbaR (Trm112 family)